MINWKAMAAAGALVTMLFLSLAPAQRQGTKKEGAEPASKKETEAAPKATTTKVEKKPFKIALSLKGILESDQPLGISHRPSPIVGLPYNAAALTILKVVPHGAKVKKGELLISFDTRRIDQAIAQVEAELQVAVAGIKLAEEEQPLLEKSVPVELETAERAKRDADDDLSYFIKTGRPIMEKRADSMLKHANFHLEYAKEQLRQLEKMYKSHDLTEDTEQIILKRQRFVVEEATNDLKLTELERDYVLKTMLPRRETAYRESVVKQTHALEKARFTLAPMLSQKQKNLAKMRSDRDRLSAGLEMLQKDRAAMTLLAPVEGIVYYGKFGPGHWENAGAESGKLQAGGSVMPDEVFMTIVKAGALFLRLEVEEKDVHLLKNGLAGKAKMTFNPDLKLPARVTKVATLPSTPGKFEAIVAVEAADRSDLMPGMAATVRFVPYANKEAIVVASTAIYEEDDNHFVDVLIEGKRQRRQVATGRSNEGQTEIVSGLAVGEEIFPHHDEKKSPPQGE